MKVLLIDVGGTNIKMSVGNPDDFRKFPSGKTLTAAQMVTGVLDHTGDWEYDHISIGYPGLIRHGQPTHDPINLGDGWVGFDFEKAFGRPVRLINDAALHALAHYRSGRMLFVSLGTSIGTTLIADHTIIPLEAGLLRLTRRQTFASRLGDAGFDRLGRAGWEKSVWQAIDLLRDLFDPDQIVLGGGNAKNLRTVPAYCEIVNNAETYRGALRLWPGTPLKAFPEATTWRLERRRKKTPAKKSPIKPLPAKNTAAKTPSRRKTAGK